MVLRAFGKIISEFLPILIFVKRCSRFHSKIDVDGMPFFKLDSKTEWIEWVLGSNKKIIINSQTIWSIDFPVCVVCIKCERVLVEELPRVRKTYKRIVTLYFIPSNWAPCSLHHETCYRYTRTTENKITIKKNCIKVRRKTLISKCVTRDCMNE